MGFYQDGQWYPSYTGEQPPGSTSTAPTPPPGATAPVTPWFPGMPLGPQDQQTAPPAGSSGSSGGYGGIGGYGAPNSQYSTGSSWNTGYGGTGYKGSNQQLGGGGGYGFPPGSPGWMASAGAYEQSQQAAQDALARLAPGQFLGGGYGGALGNMAMQRYQQTPGFDPAAMAAQRTMLTSQEAGSRENMLRTMNERAQASGFGDSMNLVDAEARARAGSAANLSNSLNQLEWMNQQARMQREATSAGLLGNLAGAESGYGLAYAASQMNRQFPAIPGVTPGPGGQGGYASYGQPQGGGYWSQQGRYMPGQQPYDPMLGGYGQGDPRGTSGGWSPQQPRPMW